MLQIEEASQSGCRTGPACSAVGIDKRTFERWRKSPNGDQRRGPITAPANKLSELECQEILLVANSAEHQDKSPSQIIPLLADKGIFLASESSVYRILKSAGLDAHRGRSKPATCKKPMELVATKPNQVYSWDITFLKSNIAGIFFFLYFVMDIYSRKIVGYAVHTEQCSEHASRMIDEICKAEGVAKEQLALHSDNGSPMKGATMQATLQRLGIMASFSRPSVSNDNSFSEALFKTVKYCSQYPSRAFESVEEANAWTAEFVQWYNEEHLHSGIRFVTPGSHHRGEDIEIVAKRHLVYQEAKEKKPERWSGNTRNWSYIGEVLLNCLKGKMTSCNKLVTFISDFVPSTNQQYRPI